ncbi:uncharacterized protein LOC120067593 [Benincasa hispida]|uniref:uncharacterized protein LOC120067593 n=1 Tax=Benincasa hispida TaxID=102211 RepID=UPI0019001E92|nr:uncharacterized protein LOC120067593 [Benincasa hispida]
MSKALKIREADRFPGKVMSLAHVANANKIVNEKLTKRQLKMFKRIAFGRFVDIELVFNNPLIHHMLLREVKKQGANSISFFIRGKVVTIFKEDFLLITGLWQSPTLVVRSEESSQELATRYFGNRLTSDTFHPNLLKEEYKNLVFENDDDVVKITLVYYTEIAMMGKNKQKSVVDRTLFEDVEDIYYYNSLDWGTIIWQRTFDALKITLNDKVGLYKEKTKVKKGLVMSDAEKKFRDTQIDIWVVRQIHSNTESSKSSSSSESGCSFDDSSKGGESDEQDNLEGGVRNDKSDEDMNIH